MARLISIASRHVLRQIAKPLVSAMAIGLLVLLADRLVRLLDTTLDKKNSFAVVFELLAYLLPHYLGLAIPAALFLGLLFGFSRISKDSELDSFMAAGFGLHQLARPVILLSALISVAAFVIIGWVQPHTRYAYRALIFNVSNVDVFYLAEEGVFMRAGTRTFMLDSLERGSGGVKGVFLYDDRGEAGAETVTAQSAELIEIPGERRPVLDLERGNRLVLPAMPTAGDPPLPKQSGDFVEASTPLGKAEDTPFRGRGADQRELTLSELYRYHGDPPPAYKPGPLTAEFHKRLVNILTPILMPVLAIPFAIGRRRSPGAYRFGIALIILIVLHEMIEQGAIAAQAGLLSPFAAIWAPFLAVSIFAGINFYRACFALKPDLLEPLIDGAASVIGRILAPLGRLIRRESS